MFGLSKKSSINAEPIMVNINEDLLKKEIFSAEEAKLMGIESKNKKRNDNRREVFRQIKQQITYGINKLTIRPQYLEDGNAIYFEGLNFKVKPIWVNSHTGAVLTSDPGNENSQSILISSEIAPNDGTIRSSDIVYYMKYMLISWE